MWKTTKLIVFLHIVPIIDHHYFDAAQVSFFFYEIFSTIEKSVNFLKESDKCVCLWHNTLLSFVEHLDSYSSYNYEVIRLTALIYPVSSPRVSWKSDPASSWGNQSGYILLHGIFSLGPWERTPSQKCRKQDHLGMAPS